MNARIQLHIKKLLTKVESLLNSLPPLYVLHSA